MRRASGYRNTATRDRHRAIIRRRQEPCGICHSPIDYELPYLHPYSFVVDHIVPLNRGGLDVIENKQAACRSCNRSKSDKLEGEMRRRPVEAIDDDKDVGGGMTFPAPVARTSLHRRSPLPLGSNHRPFRRP